MFRIDTPRNPAPQDWHNANIKADLEKRRWSLRRVSKAHTGSTNISFN